jgi:phosphatidylinositol alpha-mannosyltransferase
MRILMLGSKEYPFGVSSGHDPKAGGGIEAHVGKLSKYLARLGHEVFIVTRRFPGQPSHEIIRESPGKIHVYRTPYLPNKHLRAFSYNLLAYMKSLRLIRRFRIDLIHSHAVTAGFFGVKLSRATGTPVVFTPHGLIVDWGFPTRQALSLFQRIALSMSTRVLFISREASRVLRTPKPHTLLTNGIDLEDYTTETGKSPDVRFLFLGRLEPVKGVEDLIRAFPAVLDACPRARLLIAGDGTLRPSILSLIREIGSPRIQYLGWRDPREALQNSDVFVLPSTEGGQPVALLEAMASGKLIITSLPHIKPGETGLRCPARDPQSLSRILTDVCKHISTYRKLGRSARAQAESLSWKKITPLFEREYRKALTSSSS